MARLLPPSAAFIIPVDPPRLARIDDERAAPARLHLARGQRGRIRFHLEISESTNAKIDFATADRIAAHLPLRYVLFPTHTYILIAPSNFKLVKLLGNLSFPALSVGNGSI